MVITRRTKEQHETKEAAGEKFEKLDASVTKIDLETPEHSQVEVEKKTTESTPMPNTLEQERKLTAFLPIIDGNETTGKTP